ncbi:hypothetical protein ACSTG7_23705, partial [Vibrio parahaemolyticus]
LRPLPLPTEAGPPVLAFLGRKERLKSPDQFLELLWWLPRTAYGSAILAGDNFAVSDELSADQLLAAMI